MSKEPREGWHSAINARSYSKFAEAFPLYRETSRDVIRMLRMSPDSTLVDLGCGTGATTAVALEHLGPEGHIFAIDSSAAMLACARENVRDPRVTWVASDANEIESLDLPQIDGLVCNSAIWQMDMTQVLAGAAKWTRSGGRIAFNIPVQFLSTRPPPMAGPKPPTASTAGGVEPARGLASGLSPTLDPALVSDLLRAAGYTSVRHTEISHSSSWEQDHAWLQIPIFAEARLAGRTRAERLAALEEARVGVAGSDVRSKSTWVTFAATRR